MPDEKNKEAWLLFYMVKGHFRSNESSVLSAADGYFKRLFRDGADGAPLYDYDEEFEFGPDDFEDYISHTETDFPENRWSFNAKGFKGDRSHGKGYYDRYQKQGPVKLRKKRF